MTGKFYMLFRDDCDIHEQIHWFINNYMPANRQSFEHRYAEDWEAQEMLRGGAQGVFTWDNGKFISLCFFDRLMLCPDITKDYIPVFYKTDTITIGELQ